MTFTRYLQQDNQDQDNLHLWIVNLKLHTIIQTTPLFSSGVEILRDDKVVPIVVMDSQVVYEWPKPQNWKNLNAHMRENSSTSKKKISILIFGSKNSNFLKLKNVKKRFENLNGAKIQIVIIQFWFLARKFKCLKKLQFWIWAWKIFWKKYNLF